LQALKVRAQASYTDYQHDEIEEDTIYRFKIKVMMDVLELVHNPLGAWEGVIGTQYGQQKLKLTGEEAFLAPNTTKKWSVFALEHAQFNDVHVELAARADQQKIDIEDSTKKILTVQPFLFRVLPTGSLHQLQTFISDFTPRTFTFSSRVVCQWWTFCDQYL
jgi:hypothetical protein